MANSWSIVKIKAKWLMPFILMMACIDRIEFDVPKAQLQLVVEGMISDEPAPYELKISRGLGLEANVLQRIPVENVKVKLHDDAGNVEHYIEVSPGIYHTQGAIQGQVGHTYYITLETPDGKIIESTPETIKPAGEVEAIRFEFEARTRIEPYGEVAADVFNIYVDGKVDDNLENFIRWRFTGTYKVITHPQFREQWTPPYSPYKDPPPCSGYIVVEGVPGGKLEQVGPCTCCICWVNEFESTPQLSDTQLVSKGEFKNIKLSEVPINPATFHDKYLIEVEQMNLSRQVFEFFKLLREQKESASSIFQPPIGEVKGNLKSNFNGEPVIGLFWAASISRKSIYINRSDIPYLLPPIAYITEACNDYYANALTQKPQEWEQ